MADFGTPPPSSSSSKPGVTLVASTATSSDEQQSSSSTSSRSRNGQADGSFFKSAHWTADGTTIITSSSTDVINTYVLPEDLLAPRPSPLHLRPQASLQLPEPTHAVASSPYFTLAHPSSQTVLVGSRDHPIQMFSALSSSTTQASSPSPLASYPLIKPETEAYQTPTALLWPQPGTHFLTGTANQVAVFDVRRTGSGPAHRIATIPSARHVRKGSGVGMRGTVSALAAQPPGWALVAAGTWTRWVGLYDLARSASCAATWSIAGAYPSSSSVVAAADNGRGILQAIWSPCGRYLVLNERKASGLLVYDVRVTGKVLAFLAGRSGDTNQRLSADVYPSAGGGGEGGDEGLFEVWAGTRDGHVVVWEGVGAREGAVEPSWSWAAAHGSAIGSAAMHPSGAVVATCSGEWSIADDDEDDGSDESEEEEEEEEEERGGAGCGGSGSGGGGGMRVSDDAQLSVWSIGPGTNGSIGEDEEKGSGGRDED